MFDIQLPFPSLSYMVSFWNNKAFEKPYQAHVFFQSNDYTFAIPSGDNGLIKVLAKSPQPKRGLFIIIGLR